MPETELKFELSAGDLARLGKHSAFKPKAERARLRSAYFDTPGLTLHEAGLTLRVRTAAGRNIQTIKKADGRGLFDREEWEVEVAGKTPDLAALAATPAADILDGHEADLKPVFVTAVGRAVRLWSQDDAVVEIAVDRGEIVAGQAREPIFELELELKSGPASALHVLAGELAARAPIRLAFASKSERGYRLAAGQASAAIKAGALAIEPTTNVADAFRRIMRSCLGQLGANAAILRRTQDPEVLHQTRIGLRRLRAALLVFKSVVAGETHARLKTEARWIAGELNAARNLDVFLAEIDADDPAVAKLASHAHQVRDKAYAKALAALSSPRFAGFLLDTALWVEDGAWTGSDAPVATLAASELDRRFKSLRKAVRNLTEADDATRHQARIKAKKLRYAVEFFAGVFPEGAKRRKRFQAAMRDLQDALGELNDIAMAGHSAMAATGGSRSPDLAFAAGLVAGQIGRGRPRALKAAAKAAEAFSETSRFWR